ncbi:MAG: toll/interleukin-1 receptor domain-containing protein [Actinobacteria bacterium]|nr:toll/interleukin-1 receptor domain-containing protein [Actinomycetota bacterium]
MAVFDVFLSYAHADRERVLELRDALVANGLGVWLDDTQIETFESISAAINKGLAHSKALVVFYSATYPTRRACQWELTAALLAPQRSGGDPHDRVLVINPEAGAGHIEPIELRDALFAAAPAGGDRAGVAGLGERIAGQVAQIAGELGELGVTARPAWAGRRAVGAARFVGRVRDMWQIHSALTAGCFGVIAGAHSGDPAVKVTGMGVGVGPGRGAGLSPGPFPRPALRTGRAPFSASGSPRDVSSRPRVWGSWCPGSGTG